MHDVQVRPHSPNILVVEDDADQCEYLARVIKKLGYRCVCASDCAGGRAEFVENRFACVLVDLGLPDGSGLALLNEFAQTDPSTVAVVLTGDNSAKTVVNTMRAGAFDYLTKPVDVTTLEAAISRALSHYAVLQERAELVRLLLEERETLRARVDAATADLRQYASMCETSNLRLRTLLGLTRLSSHYYSEEMLLRDVFKEMAQLLPLDALVLCDVSRQQMLTVYRDGDEALAFEKMDGDNPMAGYDTLLAEAEPQTLVRNWFERSTGVSTGDRAPYVFPQILWNRTACTVGFFLTSDFAGTEHDNEFLGMCARFLAFEWEQSNLLLQVAHQASLGNIATELVRNFVQPLTAIRTAADLIHEGSVGADVTKGTQIIDENVERLRHQTQEFRRLSLLREGSVETVRLEDYVERALEILTVAIQNRNVEVEKEYDGEFECVLLNGTALARTFLDLILGALMAVDNGGRIIIRLRRAEDDRLAFEVTHSSAQSGFFRSGSWPGNGDGAEFRGHPGMQLAERTVHSCGGKLSSDLDETGRTLLRILLPSNATDPSVSKGAIW